MLKEATEFVRRNQAVLASRPVWLFSSGPLGTKATDAKGRDLWVATEPERSLRKLPAARAMLPGGDFRDWADVQTWAEGIARELAQMTTTEPPPATLHDPATRFPPPGR